MTRTLIKKVHLKLSINFLHANETIGFLMFSGGIKRTQWHEMCCHRFLTSSVFFGYLGV